MPTSTYIGLANLTLSSSASSVTFSSIGQGFKDLVLVGDYTGSTIALVILRFNGDSSNYTLVDMFGNSSGRGSNLSTSQNFGAIYNTNRMMSKVQIMDYSATDKHKTSLARNDNAGQGETSAYFARWAGNAAITSISLTCNSGTFSSGSTFSLYGITA